MKLNNFLIDCNNKLTDTERRLFIVICNVIQTQGIKKRYTVDLEILKNSIGSNYEKCKLKKILTNMHQLSFKFIENKDNDELTEQINFITYTRYWKYKDEFVFSINEEIIKKITNNTGYVHFDLAEIMKLKNRHSLIIYMLAKNYIDINSKKYKLHDFRRIIGCENKYKSLKQLKQCVFKKVIEDINTLTDIKINDFVIEKNSFKYEKDYIISIDVERKSPIKKIKNEVKPETKKAIEHEPKPVTNSTKKIKDNLPETHLKFIKRLAEYTLVEQKTIYKKVYLNHIDKGLDRLNLSIDYCTEKGKNDLPYYISSLTWELDEFSKKLYAIKKQKEKQIERQKRQIEKDKKRDAERLEILNRKEKVENFIQQIKINGTYTKCRKIIEEKIGDTSFAPEEFIHAQMFHLNEEENKKRRINGKS